MERIGSETGSPGNAGLTLRPKARANVRLVSRCENIKGTFADGKADDGFGWCAHPPRGEKARGHYRKGSRAALFPGAPHKEGVLTRLSRMKGNFHVRF